jgi:hypothetical protein
MSVPPSAPRPDPEARRPPHQIPAASWTRTYAPRPCGGLPEVRHVGSQVLAYVHAQMSRPFLHYSPPCRRYTPVVQDLPSFLRHPLPLRLTSTPHTRNRTCCPGPSQSTTPSSEEPRMKYECDVRSRYLRTLLLLWVPGHNRGRCLIVSPGELGDGNSGSPSAAGPSICGY